MSLANDIGSTQFFKSLTKVRKSIYRTPPVADSALISLTHALWIELICGGSGTDIFLWILPNSLTTSGGCFFLSQDPKHQNRLWRLHVMSLFFDGKYCRYSQLGNRFPAITQACLEPNRKSNLMLFSKIVHG